MAIKYVPPFEDNVIPGDWRVEAMDEATGEIRLVIFKGENAEKLAFEYHAFKTGTIKLKLPAPVVVPAPAAVPPPSPVIGDEQVFIAEMKGGGTRAVRPSGFLWTFDEKRERLTGWRKSAVGGKK